MRPYGRSMPRKSKHGGKVSRWCTHREAKGISRVKFAKGDKPEEPYEEEGAYTG